MAATTSDLLVERMIDWGVDTVFGLPGDGINGFFEALRKARDRIRFVHVRHEEEGALAACGYAKFSGKLGVCCSTSGPGAVHLLNGLYDAKVDGAPVLAITGMPYHDLLGTHYVQDLNTDFLFQDVALVSQRVMGAAHVVTIADRAIRAAIAHRGVAHLAIPIDIQTQEAGADKRSKRNVKGHTSDDYQPPTRVPPRPLLEKAAALFQGKQKIAMLVGAGARGAGAEVEAVADKLGAPVIKALLGKDVIPDDSPYTTGGAGLVGTRPSHEALKGCEALLIVGSSFPYIEFYPKPGQAAAVQIDVNPDRIGLRYSVDVGLAGDAKATLQDLLPLLPRNDNRQFLEQAQKHTREWWDLMEERSTRQDTPMKPQTVPWHLSEVLNDDAIIAGDSGTVTNWTARQLRLRRGQMFSFSGTLCSMASGVAYAMGAQLAFPGRQVVALVGDGGFTMLMGSFVDAVQAKLPIKVIVMKNNTLGLITWEQMVYLGNPQYGCNLMPIDFVKFAEAVGARGVRIEDPKQCKRQLAEALAMDGPVLVEAVVDAHEAPMPAMVKPMQAQHMAEALARGEPNRQRIGLTLFRDVVEEAGYPAAPSGVVARMVEKATSAVGKSMSGQPDEGGGKE